MKFENKEQQRQYYENTLRYINNSREFSTYNNIMITKVELDYAEGVLHVKPESLNHIGVVHGGCLATLADTTAGMAACSRGKGCVTANYAFNFLREARGEMIRCEAKAVKVGKSLSVIRAELINEMGVLVAVGDFTFYLIEDLNSKVEKDGT